MEQYLLNFRIDDRSERAMVAHQFLIEHRT